MNPIVIEYPQYIREAKLSDSQRAIYWEWDGVEIKAKNKKLLQKYIHNPEDVIMNNGKATPLHLKSEYHIAVMLDDKPILILDPAIHPIKPDLLKIAIMNGRLGFALTEKQNARLKFRLIDDEGNLVVDNVNKVGKPRYIKIKGQDIYSGNVREFTRGEIMSQIKDSFRQKIRAIPIITEYPVKITMELHDTVKHSSDKSTVSDQRWDVDNRAFPYCKAFPDVLYEEGKIIDDDRLHITIPAHGVFCPVEEDWQRKLVFIIQKDDRDIIKMNKHYEDTRHNS